MSFSLISSCFHYLFHISNIYLFIYSNSHNSNSEGHPGQNNRRTDYSPDTTTKDLPYHDRGGSTGGSIPAPTGPAGQHQQQHQPSFLAYKAGEVLTTGNLTDFLKPYHYRGGSMGGSIPTPTGPGGQHQQQHQPSFLAYKAGKVLTTGNLTDFLKP